MLSRRTNTNSIFITTHSSVAKKICDIQYSVAEQSTEPAIINYGMRDEQEKCCAFQKGPLGHDRLRTWSKGGKRGRMFIYFAGLILASYIRSVWQKDDVLRKKFSSTEAVLAEMRTIRCNEHTGKIEVYHSVRRVTGRHLQGLWLHNPRWLCTGLCLQAQINLLETRPSCQAES